MTTSLDIVRSSKLVHAFYFFYYGGCACIFPFLSLFLGQLGLSASQVGVILGSKYLVWNFMAPLLVLLAVRVQKIKLFLALAVVFTVASNVSLTLISPASNGSTFGPCLLPSSFSFSNSSGDAENMKQSKVLVQRINETFSTVSNDQSRMEMTLPTTFLTSTTIPKIIENHSSTQYNKLENVEILTTALYVPSTSLSSYQMALRLRSRITQRNPKTIADLQQLVSKSEETKTLPQWKQRAIVHLLMKTLGSKTSDKNSNKFQPSTTTSPAKKEKHFTEFDDVLKSVVNELLPKYLLFKQQHPTVDPETFVLSLSQIKPIPVALQSTIVAALKLSLKDLKERPGRIRRDMLANSSTVNLETTESRNLSSATDRIKQMFMTGIATLLPSLTNNLDIFFMVLVIVLAGESLGCAVDLLSNSTYFEFLDKLDYIHLYGNHKIFAQVATVFAAIAISVTMYLLPCCVFNTVPKIHMLFYSFAFMAGFAFILIPFYPTYSAYGNFEPTSKSISPCPLFGAQICSDCRRILLFITVFIAGIIQSFEYNFLFWQVQQLPGSSFLIYGLIVAGNALAAMLANLIERCFILKSSLVIPLCLLSIAAKMLVYSFLDQAWFFVPVQVINMFGPPLLWLVIDSEIDMMTSWDDEPDIVKETNRVRVFAQSLKKRALSTAYACAYQGLGFCIGSMFGGIGYVLVGEIFVPLFRVASSLSFGWAILYFILSRCCARGKDSMKYLTLLNESDDEDELYDLNSNNLAAIKGGRRPPLAYNETSKKLARSRKKKRTKKIDDATSFDEDLERNWHELNSRKPAKIL